MGKNRKIWIWALIWVSFFALMAMPLAMAEDVHEKSDTVTIDGVDYQGTHYFAIKVELPNGGGLEYEISSDIAVDIYLFDEANWYKYQSNMDAQYIGSGSEQGVTHFKTYLNLDAGNYYIVIENPNSQAATVSYDVKYGEDVSSNPWDFFGLFGSATCCIVYGVFFLIWIYVLVWVYKDAKRRGKSGAVWVLITLILGIIGLIIWLIVRPPIQQQRPPQQYYQQPPPPPE